MRGARGTAIAVTVALLCSSQVAIFYDIFQVSNNIRQFSV